MKKNNTSFPSTNHKLTLIGDKSVSSGSLISGENI